MFILLFQQNIKAETISSKKVLILSSYGSEVSISSGYESKVWTDEIIDSINLQFMNSKENVNVRMEYMGLSEESWDKYYDLYKYIFSGIKFDTIISLDDNAFRFLLKYGDILFADTPIVFSGVNNFSQDTIRDYPNFTGITKSRDVELTLDMALKLNPNTKEIFVIDDNEELIRWMSSLYKNDINMVFSGEDDIVKVKEQINNLSKDTVIYFSKAFKDNNGQDMRVQAITDFLFKEVDIPMYSRYYIEECQESVGGVITDGTLLGEEVARLALRVLGGEKPSSIPVIEDKSHNYVFNYSKLNTFNISLGLLPEGSKILNMELESYVIGKDAIISFITAIILMISIGLFLIKSNINKRRNAERLLSDSEVLFSTLINSTPNIVYFKSPNGEFIEINDSALKVLDIDESDYRNVRELSNISNKKLFLIKEWHIKDNEVLENGLASRGKEIVFCDKEKAKKVYDTLRIPLYNTDGTPQGLFFLGIDITDHLKKEENEKLIQELMYYDELRANFFSNISHELKTPLNLIFSAIQILDVKTNSVNKGESSTSKYISIMRQNCYRLLRIIDNLIDITKIDAGHFFTRRHNKDIVNVIEDIVLSIVDYVESKGISITFDTDIEEKIMAFDPDAIERIILNLLSNAIKFTPSGGSIDINIYNKLNSIVISVKDSGLGIPKEKQSSIFEKFVQVDKSLSRNREGSGIGLSLVKELVVLHKGTIEVKSDFGNGSEFIIELPINLVDEDENYIEASTYGDKDRVDRVKIEFSDIYS